MEGKKSFLEPIYKTRLKSGTEMKKKILKSLSEIFFGLLGNKAEKLVKHSNI